MQRSSLGIFYIIKTWMYLSLARVTTGDSGLCVCDVFPVLIKLPCVLIIQICLGF